MSNKKQIILTAIITFFVTAFVVFAIVAGSAVSYLMGSSDSTQKLKKIEALIDGYYIYDYDKDKMMDMALSAYTLGVGDPYTTYIDKESFSEMVEDITGNYVGIGIEVFIDSDNLITIIAPFDNSPASKAGILPGDKIVKVNGKNVSSNNYNEAIDLIRGKGENLTKDVILTVKRGEQTKDVKVKREEIVINTVSHKMLKGHVGYIRISNFGDHTGEEFEASLKAIENQGAKYLLIDLRNNPGGTLESVVKVADSLMGEGNIITIKDKKGNEKKYNSDKEQNTLPLCVLINGNSASASEALAGAIADSGRGTLVGEKSFGKGIVQTIYELGDGSAFKVTSARYFTPGGTCIDKVGIKPHIEVKLDDEYKNKGVQNIPYEKDYQLQKAVETVKEK